MHNTMLMSKNFKEEGLPFTAQSFDKEKRTNFQYKDNELDNGSEKALKYTILKTINETTIQTKYPRRTMYNKMWASF